MSVKESQTKVSGRIAFSSSPSELLNSEQRLVAFHVQCLRVISQALGNPFAGVQGKNAMDLALLAASTIKQQKARIAELEAGK